MWCRAAGGRSPRRSSPRPSHVAAELGSYFSALERDFKDVQDVEFTIDDGHLWILQARSAKRTARAALKIAVDFVHEGLASQTEALQMLRSLDLRNLAVARFAGSATATARGIGAAGGVAVGRAAFDAASVASLAASGDSLILVRPDIATEGRRRHRRRLRRPHGDGGDAPRMPR
ncbi:MAG TPA: PEP/pyruvate-binding domain-containing protein [Methyloceanibacter sp.]